MSWESPKKPNQQNALSKEREYRGQNLPEGVGPFSYGGWQAQNLQSTLSTVGDPERVQVQLEGSLLAGQKSTLKP